LAATGQSASVYDLNARRHYLNNPKTYISAQAQQRSAETEKLHHLLQVQREVNLHVDVRNNVL